MSANDTIAAPASDSPVSPSMTARLAAEALGTFVLVLGGAGTAIFAGNVVGAQGVAIAFGLTVLAGIYAFGYISGGHFNPAVTLGLVTANRFKIEDAPYYIVAQVIGGIIASTVLFAIAAGGPDGFLDNARDAGFAANGFGDHSPAGFNVVAALITEVVLTAVFLLVILGITDRRASAGFAGLAIGLTLTLIHLVSIPITNTSVNPARSLATAIYGGGWAWAQLWLFIIGPIAGAVLAGLLHRQVFCEPGEAAEGATPST